MLATYTVKLDSEESADVRPLLEASARQGVTYTERRHWLVWRLFTVTGPADVMESIKQQVQWLRADLWWRGQTLTRTITVERSLAPEVRQILAARVRLRVQERKHWWLWRSFTFTGPNSDVHAAAVELERLRDAADAAMQQW